MLIVYHVVFIIVGDFAAYFLGLFTDTKAAPRRALYRLWLSILFVYGGVLGVAVPVTKPKSDRASFMMKRRIACEEPQWAEWLRDEVVEVLGRLSDVIIA